MTTLHWSLRGIGDTLARVAALDFPVSDGMTAAALAQDDTFEGHLIREAEDTELGLFQPTRDEQGPLGDSMAEIEPLANYDDAGWQIGRRRAPVRSKALSHSVTSPPSAPVGAGDAASARGNLLAAARLTEVYPLPRFQDRIVAISAQLEGLEQSIHELQTLPPKAAASGATQTGKAAQNERLEVLALTDVRDERAAYANRLTTELAQAKKRRKIAKPANVRQTEPAVDLAHVEDASAVLPPVPPLSADVSADEPAAEADVPDPVAIPPQDAASAVQSEPELPLTDTLAASHPTATPAPPTTRSVPAACHHAVSRLVATATSQGPLRSLADAKPPSSEAFMHLTSEVVSNADTPPQTRLEAAILHHFVHSLLAGPAAQDDQLLGTETLSPGPLPYVLRPSTTFTVDSPIEDALVPLDLVKVRLAELSAENGWEEGLGQKAIYALVAKRVVRIDRKGKPLLSAC